MDGATERVKIQFPGVHVTLISIFVGLVLEDLVSVVRATEGWWPLTWASACLWIQAASATLAAMLAWVAYAHLAIIRRAIPDLLDVSLVFLSCGYLFLLNSAIGPPPGYPWFYAGAGYAVVGWVVTLGMIRQACKEPSLRSFASISAYRGPFSINTLALTVFGIAGLASQFELLSQPVETGIMATAVPAEIGWMILYSRKWRVALRLSDATRPGAAR